jgi:hypothetical protein
MAFENGEKMPAIFRRELPAFLPGSNYQGGGNFSLWSAQMADRSFGEMMASNEDGSVWIAIQGRNSFIRRSTDQGKTWRTIGRVDHLVGRVTTEYHVQTIVRFNGLFIIAAAWDSGLTVENGVSLISSDGLSWDPVDETILTDISCATSGPDKYVAGKMGLTGGANLVYSQDGRFFAAVTASPALTNDVINVQYDAFGNQYFAASSSNQLAVSLDAVSWITFTTPVSFRSIIRYGSLYYAISTTGALYSTPTLNTTTVPVFTLVANITGSGRHKFFIWNDYLYHYDGANGRIRRNNVIGTVNGVDWTTVTPIGIGNSAWVGTLRTGSGDFDDNSKLVAIWADTQVWLHTADPLAARWDNYRPSPGGATFYRDGIFDDKNGNERFLIAADNGAIYASTDLYNNFVSVRGGSSVFKIDYGNGIYMAGTNANQISWSTDGTTWNNVVPGLSQCFGTAYGTDGTINRWITIGTQTDRYSRSDNNGVSWSVVTGQAWAAAPRDIAWGPVTGQAAGAYVIVGDSGIMWRSIDLGVTWTRIDNTLPSTFTEYNLGARNRARSWTKIKYLNGYFVAVGTNIVAWSVDGLNWTYMDHERSFNQPGTFRNVFYDALKSRWVLTADSGYVAGSTSLTNPRWKRIAVPVPSNVEMGAFISGTIGETDLWFSGSTGGRYWDSYDGDRWWYRDYDWVPSGTTYTGHYGYLPGKDYGYLPGEATGTYGQASGVDGHGYLVNNTNVMYRTADFNTWGNPTWYFNLAGSNQGIENIVYGNGVWVGRNPTTEAVWYSANGEDWELAHNLGSWVSRPRVHNIIFAEGYFWGIYSSEIGPRLQWWSRLFRSKDGLNWEVYHGWRSNDPAATPVGNVNPPRWIRYTGGYFVAFGHRRDNTNDSRYFWYSNDLLVRSSSWTRGDSGQLGNDFRMTDVAISSKGVVFAYEQNQSMYSPNLMGALRDARGVNESMSLMQQQAPNTAMGVWNAFTLGDRIFVTQDTRLYEVVEAMSDFTSTTTANYPLARTYQIGEWGNNSYHVQNTGVGYMNGRGNLLYEMNAFTDCTFSVYNSAVPVIEYDRTIS